MNTDQPAIASPAANHGSLFSQIVELCKFIDSQPRNLEGINKKDKAIIATMRATGLPWEDVVTLIRISRQNPNILF